VIPSDYFKADNVAQLVTEGMVANFMYQGDVNVLFKKVAALEIEDAFIEEPTLEEIFLHYYK
jgi:ABC-2 type transport system ATP-binding protein